MENKPLVSNNGSVNAEGFILWMSFLCPLGYFLPVKDFGSTHFVVLLVMPFLSNALVEITYIRKSFSLETNKKVHSFISGIELSLVIISTFVLYAWYTKGETNPELEPLFVACGVSLAAVERARKKAKKHIEK